MAQRDKELKEKVALKRKLEALLKATPSGAVAEWQGERCDVEALTL